MEPSNRTSPNRRGENPLDLRPLPSSPPDSPLNRPLPPSLSRLGLEPPPPPRLAPGPVSSRPPPSSPPRSTHPFLNRPLPPSISLRQPPPPPHLAPRPFLSRPLQSTARLDHWRPPAYRHGTQLNSVNRFHLLSLLDCDEDITSASDSAAGHGADNNDGRNSGEDAAVCQQTHSADNNDGLNSGEDAAVRQHRHDAGNNDGRNSGEGADNNDGLSSGEGAAVPQYTFRVLRLLDDGESLTSDSSGCSDGDVDNDEDEECSIEFTKYLEEEASKPEEKELTKEETLKLHSNRMERYMKSALQKYNVEEKLPEDMYFEFDEVRRQNWIVEGDYDNQYYHHFNFSATQACSRTCLFFAEAIPGDGDSCDITCCKLLNDDDNGHCYGCKNRHVNDLRHPACGNVYVGGHIDRMFPFLIDTESEDDSD